MTGGTMQWLVSRDLISRCKKEKTVWVIFFVCLIFLICNNAQKKKRIGVDVSFCFLSASILFSENKYVVKDITSLMVSELESKIKRKQQVKSSSSLKEIQPIFTPLIIVRTKRFKKVIKLLSSDRNTQSRFPQIYMMTFLLCVALWKKI